MKLLYILPLFLYSIAGAQDVFKPGYYQKGALVKDSLNNIFKAKSSFNARTYPKSGSYWELVTVSPLEQRIEAIEKQLKYISTKTGQGVVRSDSTGITLNITGKRFEISTTDSTIIIK